ncbi:hypothetical protein [Paenibacillus humicus]|uniref:hypothetical protein n=1 Tax=Paenibacillus humicus TaxID=412861 RepID=UPI000FDAB17A|nr:hypothetical protein [Paenibacillus humicus]
MMQGGRTVRPGTGRQDGRGSGYGRTGRAKAAGNGRTTSPNEKGKAGSKADPTRYRSGKAGRTRYRSRKTNPTRDRSSGGNSAVYPGWKPLSAAVVAGSDAGQLAEAAEIMRRKGFSPVIEMLYRAGSRLGGAGETEAASNRSEADVRHPDLDAIHVHEALAAGSVLAAASEKDAVLYADAGLGADALARLPAQALIAKAVSSRRPCAAVPSSTSRAVPFSSWSKSMVLSAFMHWSLGEETRSFASMERAVFALNRKAAELLQGDALADPAEALATLLAAGGKAVTVTAPAAAARSARAGKPLPEEGVRCAQAVVRILERKGGPRSAFPDYDRRRDVAGKESD